MKEDRLLVVLSTFPDAASARAAAETLVNERFAACVNILPGVESIYRWQEKVESSQEVLAVIKTTADRYPELEKRLREMHPYDVPEIVALSALAVGESYLAWAAANTRAE